MIKIIIGVIIVAAVVIGGFMLMEPAMKKANTPETSEKIDNTNAYSIEGEISKEGTYKISGLVTMADLIEVAGGVTNNADSLSYFDTAELKAGSSYYVGAKYDTSDICNNTPIVKVNINSDTEEKLTTITGITTTIASAIVSYRTEIGTYQTIEQLLDVYGIGNATYRKVRNYVTLHE